MKNPEKEIPEGNQFFARIKFREFWELWLISGKLVPVKIISKVF